MRAALYARCSTKTQDTAGQIEELRRYTDARGFNRIGEYVDAGVSGSKDSRPELNRMMVDAKKRSIDVIIITKLDRLGRSLRHLVNLMSELQAIGVQLISLGDNLDLTTPSGKLLFNVIASMAEFERDLIRERTIAGLARAKANGKQIGRKQIFDRTEMLQLSEKLSNSQLAKHYGVSRQAILKAKGSLERAVLTAHRV